MATGLVFEKMFGGGFEAGLRVEFVMARGRIDPER